jgi:F0F1-type ATP synthase assembly protein I
MVWRFIGIGWYVPLCLVLGAFVGYKLDGKLDTAPMLAVVGLTLGLMIAFIGIYLLIKPLRKEEQRKGKGKG